MNQKAAKANFDQRQAWKFMFEILKVTKLDVFMAASFLATAASQGVSVNFGDANRSPSSTLVLDGVTVTGFSWNGGASGQPATIVGMGLGSATLGSAGSLDRQIHFLAGTFGADLDLQEGLGVSVNGRINSITFAPYFSIVNSAGSICLPFQLMVSPVSVSLGDNDPAPCPDWISFNSPYPTEITYSGIFDRNGVSSFNITLGGSGNTQFYDYLEAQNFPDVTFEFGVQIKSIDFTPVPEPGMLSMFCLGLLGLTWQHSRRKCL